MRPYTRHHALKTAQCSSYIKNYYHRGRYVLGMSRAVFMPRNPYFSAIQVRKPRVHVRSQEWGTGHRRTSTDSGGVTCALGRRRTAGQAAGPESEEWAPEWGQGDAGCTDGKGWGHKHACPSRKRFSGGEGNAHPRNEGGGEGCAVQAQRAARGR